MDKGHTKIAYDQVSWIRDFLAEDLPQARLLFFNYDSTTYNNAPQKDIEDISRELLRSFSTSGLRTTDMVGNSQYILALPR
jgi:spore cortex formation protein SpoVR/YcgB (stage V sporulation)